MFEHFWTKYIFFNIIFLTKVFKFTWQIRNRLNWMKNQISDYHFSSYGHFLVILMTSWPQFSMNFHDNSKNKNRKQIYFISFFILVSTFRIIHKNRIKTEACRSVGNTPRGNMCRFAQFSMRRLLYRKRDWIRGWLLWTGSTCIEKIKCEYFLLVFYFEGKLCWIETASPPLLRSSVGPLTGPSY